MHGCVGPAIVVGSLLSSVRFCAFARERRIKTSAEED